MKIIGTDNLNRDAIADRLVVGGIPESDENRTKAQSFCDWLNTLHANHFGGTWYIIVPDGYRLSQGMEDLI